jgi:putative component of membrane protein insertase Oxa1/YidC/SpoIIIJ protein YidD
MKGYENQIVQHCMKDFNQGKDNTTLIYDDGFTKKSIPVKIPEEYTALTQLLTEDKINMYEICENYQHIYETYCKVLEKIKLEHDRHKEREIPEVAWIYGLPGSGKTEFAQGSLKTYDIMTKKDFVYTGLRGHKNIIYENVTNNERLEDLIKMFSDDHLIIKIPHYYYNFLPSIIYVTCQYDPKEFCSHYRLYKEKSGYDDLLLKIDRIAECERDPNTNQFTVTLQ